MTAIASELADRPDGLAELAGAPAYATGPPPRLLGPFDPVLLGWSSRAAVLHDRHQEIVTTNGVFRPFALVAGRAAGIWSYRSGQVELRPFDPMPADVTAALDAETADVRRFLATEPAAAPGAGAED
jgi:hypothetical protein